MAIKKSDLYSSLWASCDALRGGMDASQYKDYVLALLFIKYVSDKYAGVPFAPITVPKGASFADMVALKGKPDIGDQINKKIARPLFDANKLADYPDFNDGGKLGSGKELVDRLTDLIGIFQNPALGFSKHRAADDDLLGDAYEYLMRHFATESGKSKGQFYTPAEVSRVIAKVIGIRDTDTTSQTTVYDPTCGSGSLLLKVADEARAKVTLYGQEKDSSTAGLARMNMILHDNITAIIEQGNTLANPRRRIAGQGRYAPHADGFRMGVKEAPARYRVVLEPVRADEDVPPGYQRTEVGVIPEDWRVESIASIADVGRGRVISHREIARSPDQKYPVYSSQTSDDGVMGYINTFEFEGDYITWTTDGVNAGTVFCRSGRFNCTNVCGMIKLKFDDPEFVSGALGRVTKHHVSRHLGSPKLMNDVMKGVKIALPPTVAEQHAIAEALSGADALIESLQQLIAKQRALKQGACRPYSPAASASRASLASGKSNALATFAP